MNRRTYLRAALVLSGGLLLPAGVLSIVGRSGLGHSKASQGFNGRIMGTGYSVTLGNHASLEDTVHPLVLAELQAIDTAMSTWRSASEISQFNNGNHDDWHAISASTMDVLQHALNTSRNTHGAFDVSVGPLVNLWGFGADNPRGLANIGKPSTSLIEKTMSLVDYQSIQIDVHANTIRKLIPSAQLDLSGVAKGYAVDQVAHALDVQGVSDYLIEVGGELRSRGARSRDNHWRVAIERPSTNQRAVFRVLELKNNAIATSGDYRNFYMDGGIKYSHTIDPRTGTPIRHELASVTVVAPTTMQADSLSTAFMVMGPSEALSFASQHNIAAHFIMRSASGHLEEILSDGLSEYLA